MSFARSRITVVVITGFVIACGEADTPAVTVDGVTRGTRGETTFVRTSRDGEWGPLHDAVEVLRVAERSPETTFGAVYVHAATPDGGVILLDSRGPGGMIIRQFDSAGTFVRNIGREGSGPGEYASRGQTTFTVHPGGTIIVRDGGRAIIRYAADGTHINTFATGLGRGGTLEIYAANDGSVYHRAPFGADGSASASLPPLIHRAPDGNILDSVKVTARWLRDAPTKQYDPLENWFPMPDGRIIYVRTDKLGFLLVEPKRRTPPFLAEAEALPVPYVDEERAELTRIDEWREQVTPPNMRRQSTPIPQAKPIIRWGGIVDLHGRIWFRLSATAEKSTPRVGMRSGRDSMMVTYDEPVVFAAFQQDGTYLGAVRFPIGAIVSFVGNAAWAIIPGDDGVPSLVKYRIADR